MVDHLTDGAPAEALFPDDGIRAERPEKVNEGKRSIRYITRAVLEFGKVSGLAELLDRVAWLCAATGYSPYNALLVLLQRPAARFVLPAHQWLERYGYVVRPGEQPMVLLQPGGPVMFLLDESQVEPGQDVRPLPLRLTQPYAMRDVADIDDALHWTTDNARYDGVRVSSAGLGTGFAGCVRACRSAAVQEVVTRRRPETVVERVPVRYDVELNRSHSPTEHMATLAHELGHVYCGHLGDDVRGHWKARTRLDLAQRELEAESVARVVFGSLAPGVTLPPHLDQYFAHEPELAGADLEAVLRAAGRVLAIAGGWGPRWTSEPSGPTTPTAPTAQTAQTAQTRPAR